MCSSDLVDVGIAVFRQTECDKRYGTSPRMVALAGAHHHLSADGFSLAGRCATARLSGELAVHSSIHVNDRTAVDNSMGRLGIGWAESGDGCGAAPGSLCFDVDWRACIPDQMVEQVEA